MTESFWAIPDAVDLRTPVTILKEQAEALTQATKGILKGEVSIDKNSYDNSLTAASLMIRVPFINDYSIRICSYSHGLDMYPGDFMAIDMTISEKVSTEEQFVIRLRDSLSSNKVKNILANLLSQARAA